VTLAAGSLVMSAACSATGDGTTAIDNGGSNGTGATGSGATGGSINPGSGGSINPGSGGSIDVPDAGNGMCIRIGLLGRRPSYGAMPGADNTDALQAWLNAHVKTGTTVSVVSTDTPITAEFLGGFEVVILQALEQQEGGPYWTFDQAELDAFEAWVRAGGGVITLTGYGAQTAEVNPTNQLLAFSGMAYNTDDVMGTCPDNCCYCAGSSIPLGGWHAEHPIAANVTSVGAFHGRTVSAGDGAIVASVGTAVYGATKELDAGRVFVFFDEWVTYSSQWSEDPGAGGFTPEASCLETTHACYGRTPAKGYQVPQFWYNALKWASGDAGCFDFTDDVPIVR
jgi:hypothetical protein